MITRLYIVRHGQSEGNIDREFHGQYDSSLTDLGHTQAQATAKWLDCYPLDVIYSSDLKRAFDTAAHTAKRRGMEIIPHTGLREICAGEWEKVLFTDIAAKWPKDYAGWEKFGSDFRCPGGESLTELYDRIIKTVTEIAAANPGKNVMLATHATPIRMLRYYWDGVSLDSGVDVPWASNASVTIADYDCDTGAFTMLSYGLAEHLEGLVSVPNFTNFENYEADGNG